MAMIFNILLAFSIQATASGPDCLKYSLRCECTPAVPFEGFQVYVVETCDGKEYWEKYFNQSQFDTQEDCQKAVNANKNCNGH